MIRTPILIVIAASVIGLSWAVSSTAYMIEVSGESLPEISDKPNAPRYSETCAHGHNGFDCKTPKHKVDVSALQEKTTELELRIAVLESQR